MLEKYCDILVIGTELPGLITAAFLARRGLSVQVIDSDLFDGHDKLPDPKCLCHTHSKFMRSILGRLNVPETTIQNFLNKESTLQYIFPKHRIDVFNNPLNFFEEMEREFPAYEADIKRFFENQAKLRHKTDVSDLFQKLIPSTWSEKRNFKKFIEEQQLDAKSPEYKELLEKDPRLASFFQSQVILAYQQLVNDPFAFQVSELFNPGDGEIFSVQSGMEDLKRMLWDRIQHYDGNVRRKVQINGLLYRNGIFEGADLDDNQGHILSKYIIWNSSLNKLAEVLPKKWKFKKLRKYCADFSYEYHWFTARYSIDTKYIPEPMMENVVYIEDENKPLMEDNFLYLQVEKNKIQPVSHVDVNFMLPASALNEGPGYFTPFFEKILERLKAIFPFSEENLQRVFPVEQEAQPQDTLFPLNEDDFEIFKHAAFKAGINTQHADHFEQLIDMHYKTPTPNFYISHPSIFAAFGIESKLILGLKITDSIWQEVEKVKKRAMKSERRIA